MATPITTMTVTTRAIMNHFTGANLNIITWQSQRVAWDTTTRNTAVPTRPTIIRFLLITAFFHIILAAIVTVTPTDTSPTRTPSQLINLVNKQPYNALWPSFWMILNYLLYFKKINKTKRQFKINHSNCKQNLSGSVSLFEFINDDTLALFGFLAH